MGTGPDGEVVDKAERGRRVICGVVEVVNGRSRYIPKKKSGFQTRQTSLWRSLLQEEIVL